MYGQIDGQIDSATCNFFNIRGLRRKLRNKNYARFLDYFPHAKLHRNVNSLYATTYLLILALVFRSILAGEARSPVVDALFCLKNLFK
jgi:hypothetical protein